MKKIIFSSLIIFALFYSFQADASNPITGKNKSNYKPAPCTTPTVTIIPGDTTICEGSPVSLTATGGGTYLWNTGATTSTINVLPLSPIVTYTVTVTVDTCSASATVTVNVIPSPYGCYIIPTTATICPSSGGVNLNIQGRMGPWSYSWSPSTGLSCTTCPNPTATPTTTTTYRVEIIDYATGCAIWDSITVTVANSLTASILGPGSICQGDTATLTASGGSTYLWNTGATTNVIRVSPNTTTTYTIHVASGSCHDSTTFKVTVDSCALGISSIVQNKARVVIFPNPNKGIFHISISNVSAIYNLEIYNVLGENIYQTKLNSGNTEINLSELPRGIYFYRVNTPSGGFAGSGKLIIEHP